MKYIKSILCLVSLASASGNESTARGQDICSDLIFRQIKNLSIKQYLSLSHEKQIFTYQFGVFVVNYFDVEQYTDQKLLIVMSDGDVDGLRYGWTVSAPFDFHLGDIKFWQENSSRNYSINALVSFGTKTSVACKMRLRVN